MSRKSNDDFRRSVDQLFNTIERRIAERIRDSADEDGLIEAVVADRIFAEEFAPVVTALDRVGAAVTANGLDGVAFRNELEPMLALMRKGVLDRVRPH